MGDFSVAYGATRHRTSWDKPGFWSSQHCHFSVPFRKWSVNFQEDQENGFGKSKTKKQNIKILPQKKKIIALLSWRLHLLYCFRITSLYLSDQCFSNTINSKNDLERLLLYIFLGLSLSIQIYEVCGRTQ